jgi:hypothetical protein
MCFSQHALNRNLNIDHRYEEGEWMLVFEHMSKKLLQHLRKTHFWETNSICPNLFKLDKCIENGWNKHIKIKRKLKLLQFIIMQNKIK